jgi:hypothetical protein
MVFVAMHRRCMLHLVAARVRSINLGNVQGKLKEKIFPTKSVGINNSNLLSIAIIYYLCQSRERVDLAFSTPTFLILRIMELGMIFRSPLRSRSLLTTWLVVHISWPWSYYGSTLLSTYVIFGLIVYSFKKKTESVFLHVETAEWRFIYE